MPDRNCPVLPLSGRIIAATRTEEEFLAALASRPTVIFDLSFDLLVAARRVRAAHEAGKRLYIHADMARGIGRDDSGLAYLARLGVDGIISTKVGTIKSAREAGLLTVQRCFLVDSRSIETAAEAIRTARPDLLECMPGTVDKAIRRLRDTLPTPLIAGGLIETRAEVAAALAAGAAAVSTAKHELWDIL